MNFLICPTSRELVEAFGPEGLFEDAEGYLFNYQVEFQEDEMVRITDSLGRIMPLDIGEVEELSEVLFRIALFQKSKEVVADIMYDNLTKDLHIGNSSAYYVGP